MSKFEQSELLPYLQLFISMLSEKQSAGITAHVDVSDWTKALGKMISLSQQIESGELMLVGVDLADGKDEAVTTMTVRQGIPPCGRQVWPQFNKTETVSVAKYIGAAYEPHLALQESDMFNKRKLRDAIVKAVNLSEPAATRIVSLNKGHSVKELVYMALQVRGAQLCSARDQKQDSEWYANHHISAVLNEVEQLMMKV